MLSLLYCNGYGARVEKRSTCRGRKKHKINAIKNVHLITLEIVVGKVHLAMLYLALR